MVTWDDAVKMALELPETAEGGTFGYRAVLVKGKSFVWERPLRKSDHAQMAAIDQEIPDGPIMAAYTADLGEREATIAEDPDVFFTIPHFKDFRAVLVLMDKLPKARARELITEAWLARAPKRLAAGFLENRNSSGG